MFRLGVATWMSFARSRLALTSAFALAMAALATPYLGLPRRAGLLDGLIIFGLSAAGAYVGTFWALPRGSIR